MTSGFGAKGTDLTVIAVMLAILLYCDGGIQAEAATNDDTSNEGLEMTAGQNMADIMRTIKLLRRENAELREDKDQLLGESIRLRKRLAACCPCREETAESTTGGRWKFWKTWFSASDHSKAEDAPTAPEAAADESGMWRSTFHRIRNSIVDFIAAAATVTGTSLRIMWTIFWLCVAFIVTNVLCLMWLKATVMWKGCRAVVKWYFHLPIWVVLGIVIQKFIQLLRRLQWESEPEGNDDDLRQELREVKNALRELRRASDEKRGSRVDKPDTHARRRSSDSPGPSAFPRKDGGTPRGKRCKRCGGDDHPIWTCPARPNKPSAPCPICRGMHWKDECPKQRKDRAYAASTCMGSDIDDEFSFRSGRSSPRGGEVQTDEGCSHQPTTAAVSGTERDNERPLLHVQGRIENEPRAREFLIDSGSSANLISRTICEEIGHSAVPCDVTEVYGVSGEGLPVLGQTTLNTHLGSSEKKVTYLVVPQLGKTILGTPALRQFEFSINCSEEYLQRPCGERLFCHAASKDQLQKNF